MIQLKLLETDLNGEWTFSSGAWRCCESYVRPFDHPSIETFLLENRDHILIVVREALGGSRAPPNAAPLRETELESTRCALLQWPLNVNVLCISKRSRTVTFATGTWASAPVFFTTRPRELHADWDLARLYWLIPLEIDFARASYILCRLGTPYSRRTIFPGVIQSTERSTTAWNSISGELELRYPEAAPRAMPRTLSQSADIHGAFEDLFAATLRRWVQNAPQSLACELSGGLDSAVATIVAAKAFGTSRMQTFGLLLPGDQKTAQQARRNEVIRGVELTDRALDTDELAPFGSGALAEVDPVLPWGEYYREAFGALGDLMVAQNCKVLVRGIGGDEISETAYDGIDPFAPAVGANICEPIACPSFLSEKGRSAAQVAAADLDPAPAGPVARSFYEGVSASAPLYMRRGVWPIYPYGTPELVNFCRGLPTEWRCDRRLQRSYLHLNGFSASVVRPDPPESFLQLRDLGLRHSASQYIKTIFEKPRLADLGLVNPKMLMESFERCLRIPDWHEAANLFEAATMETMIRTWESAEGPEGAADPR
jgi:asparagine synthase (glutamine-hydrolysing)